MDKTIILILTCFLLYSCNTTSREEIEDANYNNLDSLATLAIGDIYLGIDEYTFNEKREHFLLTNPTINGLQIDKMNGKFYKGRLYEIEIFSAKKFAGIWGAPKPNYSEIAHKVVRGEKVVVSEFWSFIYRGKYRTAYIDEGWFLNKYFTLKKGKCTIDVYDDYTPLNRFKEYIKSIPTGKLRYKYCSYIHIYDENILERIKLDKERQEEIEEGEATDLI